MRLLQKESDAASVLLEAVTFRRTKAWRQTRIDEVLRSMLE